MNQAEFYISKRTGKAITEYKMIANGDRIAVAVSGGKDSMALLKVLLDRKTFVPIKYHLLALHIDLGYPKSVAHQLEKYFKQIDVDYRIVKAQELKNTEKGKINCFWCSWNRRKHLFQSADKLGFNVVALGHHKDDIAQTILLNLFFQGEISAMKPVQKLFNGKIKIIRPFLYVEEKMIKRFVKENKLPVFECVCPQASLSRRRTVAGIIQSLERICPEVKTNILNSLKRINKDYLL
ncbi:MAG: tRNA 2-thiocytidine(32) synthetase TtcA [Candidatus Omnitrophica bacterium]|nr:tRNA 2-thiocytidine(32) synthetase TtcA [Candidatus Omnitrophota bacterium]